MWVAFAFAKATHIFQKKILVYLSLINDQSFNDTSTINIVSSEQFGPDCFVCE